MRKFGILKVLGGGALLAGGVALAGAMFQLGRLSMAVDTIGLCISRDGEDGASDEKTEDSPKEAPETESKAEAETPAETGACGEDGEFSLDEEALAAAMLEMSEPGEYL